MTTAPLHSADDAFIRLSPQEWRQAAEARLRDLGLTYGELEQQAKEHNFVSTAARKLWVLIGGTLGS